MYEIRTCRWLVDEDPDYGIVGEGWEGFLDAQITDTLENAIRLCDEQFRAAIGRERTDGND